MKEKRDTSVSRRGRSRTTRGQDVIGEIIAESQERTSRFFDLLEEDRAVSYRPHFRKAEKKTAARRGQ